MKLEDIVIGESYRHKDHPTYAWARAIRIIPPNLGINYQNYPVVEVEWTVDKDDNFGLFKYFKASDLVKGE